MRCAGDSRLRTSRMPEAPRAEDRIKKKSWRCAERRVELLGGSTEGKKGKLDIVLRAKTVHAVLDFAEASQRFRSRAP